MLNLRRRVRRRNQRRLVHSMMRLLRRKKLVDSQSCTWRNTTLTASLSDENDSLLDSSSEELLCLYHRLTPRRKVQHMIQWNTRVGILHALLAEDCTYIWFHPSSVSEIRSSKVLPRGWSRQQEIEEQLRESSPHHNIDSHCFTIRFCC